MLSVKPDVDQASKRKYIKQFILAMSLNANFYSLKQIIHLCLFALICLICINAMFAEITEFPNYTVSSISHCWNSKFIAQTKHWLIKYYIVVLIVKISQTIKAIQDTSKFLVKK